MSTLDRDPDLRMFVTRQEAADMLCVVVTTIDRWVKDGLLVKHKVAGHRTVFLLSEVRRMPRPVQRR